MFGLSSSRVRKTLQNSLTECLAPLKDELGNVPVVMQSDATFNAYMLGICEGYAQSQNVNKTKSVAIIVDAVFEEIYRRESTQVLTRIDQWRAESNADFIKAFNEAKSKTLNTTEKLDVTWFQEYASKNFEPAYNLML